jgi:23S rRNA (pseudouridine1915-N3)-methyltransferase
MIKIIAIDKIKEKTIRDCINIYTNRLDNKLKLELIEIPPARYNYLDTIKKAKIIEAEKIISKISIDSYVIALDEKGEELTSIEFCKNIYDLLNHKHLTYIIGGSYGLSEIILNKADKIMSLSKMTLTHEMARLFLIEQIYRAYTIYNNIKYHH